MVETLGMPPEPFLRKMPLTKFYFVRERQTGDWDHPPLGTARVVRSRKNTSLHYYVKHNVSFFERPRLESVEDCACASAELPPWWSVILRDGRPVYIREKSGQVLEQRQTRPVREAFQDRFGDNLRAVKGFDRYFQVLQRVFAWQPEHRISAKEAADSLS
jgi:hypothetical protein